MSESLREGMKRAVILFDTRYGNTEKIAKALELGLCDAGVSTVCLNVKDASLQSLKDSDLTAVGGPTEAFTASRMIKEFIGKLGKTDLDGKYCFAFDTKIDSRFSGSAAKYIEKNLSKLGVRILFPRESAIVKSAKGKPGNVELKELEEARFHTLGAQLGKELVAKAGSAITV